MVSTMISSSLWKCRSRCDRSLQDCSRAMMVSTGLARPMRMMTPVLMSMMAQISVATQRMPRDDELNAALVKSSV